MRTATSAASFASSVSSSLTVYAFFVAVWACSPCTAAAPHMPLTSASAIAYFAFIAALPRTSTCTVHVLAGRRKPSLTYLKRGHCGFQNGPVTNGKGQYQRGRQLRRPYLSLSSLGWSCCCWSAGCWPGSGCGGGGWVSACCCSARVFLG